MSTDARREQSLPWWNLRSIARLLRSAWSNRRRRISVLSGVEVDVGKDGIVTPEKPVNHLGVRVHHTSPRYAC